MMNVLEIATKKVYEVELKHDRSRCPVCSDTRKKKNELVVSWTLENENSIGHCHHCNANFKLNGQEHTFTESGRTFPPKSQNKDRGQGTKAESVPSPKKEFKIETRDFNESELAYWRQFKITPEILKKYKVLAVVEFSIGKLIERSSPGNPIFCYCIEENRYKIYRPEASQGQLKFLWLGGKPENWFFGLEFCTGSSEIYITGGEKDVLTLASHGKEAFTLNSETATLKAELAEKLKKQYKNVIILYDNDKTGMPQSIAISNEFGLTRGIIPADVKKDVSDLIRAGRSMDEIVYEKPKSKPAAAAKKYDFFYSTDRNGIFSGVKINYDKYDIVLYSLGFRRFDIEKETKIYIRVQEQVIEEVSKNNIQDHFMSFLRALPEKVNNEVTREMLIEKFKASPNLYFTENRYNFLIPDRPFEFNNDTKKEAFIYYKNGFVRCTPEGYEIEKYTKLKGFIWKRQILERDFKKMDKKHLTLEDFGMYGKFINNIAGQNDERWRSICSIIGYNLHSFTQTKLKATVLTDSKIAEKPEGRTGKTLFCKALGKIKNYCEINGKEWNPRKDFKYQAASIDTQIIHINDVKNNKRQQFDFEDLFIDITEGVTVEKKNQQPFTIHPKMLVSTNKTLDIEGASAKDRSIEFEFSEYYYKGYGPDKEFGVWLFGDDFPKEEWTRFDNFMMWCICFYLDKGLIDPPQINLNQRKLLDRTGIEFVEFMKEKLDIDFIKAKKSQVEYLKDTLHTEFLDSNPDLKDTHWKFQRNFTAALKYWAKYTDVIKDEVEERKNDKDRFITFYVE